MRDHEQAFLKAGANLAAIGLGDAAYAQSFRENSGILFPLLVDQDREAFRAAELGSGTLFHLFRRDNHAARKRVKAAGGRQHRMGRNALQLGGSFAFAPGNIDLFVHVSRTFSDNADPTALLEAVTAGIASDSAGTEPES